MNAKVKGHVLGTIHSPPSLTILSGWFALIISRAAFVCFKMTLRALGDRY